MHEHSTFFLLDAIPFLNQLPYELSMTLLVMVGIGFMAAFMCRKWQPVSALVPSDKISLFSLTDIVCENLLEFSESVLGSAAAKKHFSFIASLFFFIFFSNLVGLIPGLKPPTDNLNVTLALGAFVFFYYNWEGFKEHGFSYLKHFFGPVIWLAPLMFTIEIVSHLFRPLSLALRLRGNIMGDHIVLGVFSDLIPAFVPIPVIFYALGVFVSFMQALVFCLMSMVYILLSTSHD